MSVAFLILAHDNPRHLARLIERLSGPGAKIYVHIDRKADRQAILNVLPPGVAVVPRHASLPVYWGGYNMVRAELSLLALALEDASNDRFSLLSGADYPVASHNRIIEAVNRPGQQVSIARVLSMTGRGLHDTYVRYMRLHDNPIANARQGTRLTAHVNRVLNRIPRHAPVNFVQVQGSQWWTLDRRGASYVIAFLNERRDIARWFRYVNCPDEIVFGSVLKNSPLAGEITQDWTRAPMPESHHRHLHGIHYINWDVQLNGSPKTLVMSDLADIMGSDAVLARKFDPVGSASLLDALDRVRS